MNSMLWYFVGTLCMFNDPQMDCKRVVFDHPMHVTDLDRCCDKVTPHVFETAQECVAALPERWDKDKPFAVMGSYWAEIGCTQRR